MSYPLQLLDVLDTLSASRYRVYDIQSALTAYDSSPAVAEIGFGSADVTALVDLETELRYIHSEGMYYR